MNMLKFVLFIVCICAIQAQPIQQQQDPAKPTENIAEPNKEEIIPPVNNKQEDATKPDVEKNAEQSPADPSIEPIELRRRRPPHRNMALQRLVDEMWRADHDRPNIQLDWGNHMQGDNDESPNDLIVRVDESIFKRPQYQALLEMYQADVFTPNVCENEQPMDNMKQQIVRHVFNTFTETPVFKIAYKYLRDHGVADNLSSLKEQLWTLWMGTYSRCHHGVHGSSGWEHVFVGEWKGSEVDGQHSWVKYYTLQQAGQIDYHGYLKYDSDLIGSFQYTWANHLKKVGGFFLATSPAFDFSLFTVCALTEPGADHCRFTIEQFPISVISYTQSCDAGLCLATSYPSE